MRCSATGRGGSVTWGVIADVIGGSSRRVVVAEQTREDKPRRPGESGAHQTQDGSDHLFGTDGTTRLAALPVMGPPRLLGVAVLAR
jgi:hypothetical protein